MRFGENTLIGSRDKPVIRSFHSTVPAGRRTYLEHHHTECELSLFLSGSGVYTVGARAYEYRAGDVFLFGSNEVHCITEIDAGPSFDLLNIHFEPRLLWAGRELSDLSLLNLFFMRSASFENRVDRANPSTPLVAREITLLERELGEKRAGYQLMTQFRLFSALILLLRGYGYARREAPPTGGGNAFRQIELALDYIDDNLENKLTLDGLARVAAMNKTYFSGLFKRLNGISPWEYITIKRVERAIGLLAGTDMTKLDIAGRCGFNSSSNFYKAFYKVTGKRPGEYRFSHAFEEESPDGSEATRGGALPTR